MTHPLIRPMPGDRNRAYNSRINQMVWTQEPRTPAETALVATVTP